MKKYLVTVSQNDKTIEVIIKAESVCEMVSKTKRWCKKYGFVMSTQYQSDLPYYCQM
jgi:hypothetical protein